MLPLSERLVIVSAKPVRKVIGPYEVGRGGFVTTQTSSGSATRRPSRAEM